MRRIGYILVLALAVLLGGLFVGEAQAVTYDPEELTFAHLLNGYRVSQGLQPLLISDALSESGDRHSSDMGKYAFFAHATQGSDWFPIGASPWDRMAASGYNFSTYKGENIAAGHTTAEAVFEDWKGSPSHAVNMLSPNFRVVGISLVYVDGSPYRYYWTTDFGGYVDPSAIAFWDLAGEDDELLLAANYAKAAGIIVGYEDGSLGPYQPLLKRHVALVCERAGLTCSLSPDDYTPALRSDVRDSIPGLTWLDERWDEPVTRGQLVRLIWRAQ